MCAFEIFIFMLGKLRLSSTQAIKKSAKAVNGKSWEFFFVPGYWVLTAKLFIKFTFLKNYQQCFFIVHLHLMHFQKNDLWFDKWEHPLFFWWQIIYKKKNSESDSFKLEVKVPSVPNYEGAVGVRWFLRIWPLWSWKYFQVMSRKWKRKETICSTVAILFYTFFGLFSDLSTSQKLKNILFWPTPHNPQTSPFVLS